MNGFFHSIDNVKDIEIAKKKKLRKILNIKGITSAKAK